MKTPLTSVILAAALPMFALAEMTAWFNPQIETYTTWPTNNVELFGGEWVNTSSAALGSAGLEVDGELSFVAAETKNLNDGDVVLTGAWTAEICESDLEVPQGVKAAVCALSDPDSNSNYYHVVAFDQTVGSNVWVNTGFDCVSNGHFSARIGLASSMGEGFVSVVYSFGGERDYPAVIYVGGAAASVNRVVVGCTGTLSSMSAMAEGSSTSVPSRSINVNFTTGASLDASDFETLVGADGYAIPCAAWDNVVAVNGTNDVRVYRNNSGEYDEMQGLSAIVENTRGYWGCGQLASTNNLLYGYIDDVVGSMSPIVKVTGIPFENYRAVIYFSTDSANARFGHLTVNGINLTSDNLDLGTEGSYATRYGTSAWGNAGGSNSALPLAQGVNYLITPVLEGGQLDMHTHNFREGSLLVRGTIAAIQIVETEEDVVRHQVVFDIGDGAMHVGGGELVQTVVEGAAAVEPIVVATNGTFFSGWDMDFSCVTNDMLVRANYAADVPQTRYEGIVNSDMVNFDSVLWTAPKKFPDADGSYTQLFLSVLSPATLTITDHFEIGMLVLAGDCDITIRMLGDGAFYPGAINTEDYSGTLKFIVGECARLNYYLGQSSNALSPAIGVDYLPFLYFDMEVESGGTVGFTYSTNGYSNVMNLDFSRLTGDGLISLDSKYNGNANWVGFPTRMFASSLSFHNDSDIVLDLAFTDQNPFTVCNLSGNGRFRCDWSQYVMRRLRTIQTRNSMFTGRFMSNTNGNGERECNLNVASDGEAHDYENKRLILSGEGGIEESSSYWQFQDAKGTLTVERTGALEINYLWGGPADIYGAVGGCGGFSSNVVFETGAEFILSTNGHLTATGSLAFGDSLTVRTEEEPLGLLVLAVEDSVSVPDISNTDLILYVKGERSDLFRFMVMEDGLYVAPKEGVKSVRFDVGAHGHRAGGGNLLQFITEGSTIEAPAMRGDDGWVFVGWDVDLETMEDGDVATAQYKTLKADLHVDALDVPESAATGDRITIAWTVGNTGNPNWSGRTVEQIRLVDASDPLNVIVIANLAETLYIERDGGQLLRSYEWAIPAKGPVGEWYVEVETAIGASNEHGGVNLSRSEATLTIAQCPLPDLSVKSIALDLDPVEYMPLDTVTVRYVVQNAGTGAATAPWRDRLYLCKNGAKVTLSTVDVSDDIAVGAEVERTIQCVIPELVALSGDVAFVVKVDCDDSIVELADDDSNENATWEATPNATLGKRIYLTFNSASVYENSSSVRFYAKRSGETDKALVLSLSAAGATSDVTFPAEITIGAGSSTASDYVRPIDNNVVEGTRNVVFTLTPPVASGFDAVVSVLTILDNEVPKLTMSFDKVSVKEGDAAIVVTVTRELVTDEPLTVYLNGVSTSHCSYPSSVVIPAGEASVVFELAAVDNDAAEIAAALTLRASANGYTAATQSFSVEDDDVPSVTLTIYPEELSEGAGPNAAHAILSRVNEDNIGSAITVNLTPSIPNRLILPSSVTIPAYTMAVRFQFGAIDNGEDEDDQDITITGSIYIPSCGCSGQPSSGDVVEATIRIVDNDVPALSLTADPSTMKEGLDYAGDLILSHNSVLTEDLVVSLSFDTEGEIEIPASVVIPAGETSVTIPVKTIDDGETDGGKLVSVYADDETKAFKSASTWIQVSDQNLPNIEATLVSAPESVIGGEKVEVSFNVANSGFARLQGNIKCNLYFVEGTAGFVSSSTTPYLTTFFDADIGINESEEVQFVIAAPSRPGFYTLVVKLDPDNAIAELNDADNEVHSGVVTVESSFMTTVAPERDVYMQGESVVLTGCVVFAETGLPASHADLELCVTVKGYPRRISVKTEKDGKFEAEFFPQSNEMGHYSVCAVYPGSAEQPEQASFEIVALSAEPRSYVELEMTKGDVVSSSFQLVNSTWTEIAGLKYEVIGHPENCAFEFVEMPEAIGPDSSGKLSFIVTGTDISPSSKWQRFNIRVYNDDGVEMELAVKIHVNTPKAHLAVSTSMLDATLTIGQRRYLTLAIMNTGNGDSGEISFKLPQGMDWMRVVSERTIDNLAGGKSASMMLELAPPSTIAPNSRYTGSFVIAAENADSDVSVDFVFVPVSEHVGSVTIKVADTQTTNTGKYLAGAKVALVNPGTCKTVVEGTTDANGCFAAADLPAGSYILSASAEAHGPKNKSIEVMPGQQMTHTVYLEYSGVGYSWSVVTTEIEDVYTLELMAEYQTNVPVPVLRIEAPEEIPDIPEGGQHIAAFTVFNDGLINITDVHIEIDGDLGGWTFEQLSPNLAVLPPNSTAVMYGRFTNPIKSRRLLASSVADVPSSVVEAFPCTIGALAFGEALCGAKGIQLVARSRNIMKMATICNLLVNLLNGIGDFNPFSSGVSGDDERTETTKSDKEPKIRVPVEGAAEMDCECIINALDKLLGTLLDQVPGMTLADIGIDLSEAETACDYLKVAFRAIPAALGTITKVKNGAYAPSAASASTKTIGSYIDGMTGGFDTAFAIYDKCKNTFGESELMGTGKTVNNVIKGARGLYKVASGIKAVFEKSLGKNALRSHKDNLIATWIYNRWEQNARVDASNYNEINEYLATIGEFCERKDFMKILNAFDTIMETFDNDCSVSKNSMSSDLVAAFSYVAKGEEGNVAEGEDDDWELTEEDAEEVVRLLAKLREDIADVLEETGCATLQELQENLIADLQVLVSGEALSVCSKVTIRLNQSMAMTREAVEGTIEISNGPGRGKLSDIKLELSVLDANGAECYESLFGHKFTGTTNLGDGSLELGTCSLDSGETGSGGMLFVPTVNAAKDEPTVYYFGGYLSYRDETTGEEFKTKLTAVPLVVKPSPYLHLDYFLQRDVIADNPFTANVVEPSEPAELALLVRNVGNGVAQNVKIASAQPELLQNDQGLLVDFALGDYSLDSTALNGKKAHILLQDVLLDDIAPGEAKVAQWWLVSSIEGHFSGMNATVTHLDSYNNPDTSLVDEEFGVHSLVKSFDADGDDLPDFLVSDGDMFGRPTEIYTAAGSVHQVEGALAQSVDIGASNTLKGAAPSISVMLGGVEDSWNYAYVAIPGIHMYEIVEVVDQYGNAIDKRRVWSTDRVFREYNEPLREERLHIVDKFDGAMSKTYSILLAAKPSEVPEVIEFPNVEDGERIFSPMETVLVKFNQPIDPDTFTAEDIELAFEGRVVDDTESLTVQSVADSESTMFEIGGLSECCRASGYYRLTVKAIGISNLTGVPGRNGRYVGWICSAPEAPYVSDCTGISNVENGFVDSVVVTMSQPIDASTFTPEKIKVDGVSGGGRVAIAADASKTRFAISGLADMQEGEGTHELEISLKEIMSEEGVWGVYDYRRTWRVDTAAPVLRNIRRRESPAATVVELQFGEDVSSVNIASTELRLNGNPIPYAIETDGEFAYLIVDSSLYSLDGAYSLEVDVSAVVDAAGNSCNSPLQTLEWNVDNTPPDDVHDVSISPDTGIPGDGITTTGELTVSATASEPNVLVEIFCSYPDGSWDNLASLGIADELRFDVDVSVKGKGMMDIVIRQTDAAGNYKDTVYSIAIDATVLLASLSGAPEPGASAESVVVEFTDEVNADEARSAVVCLTLDGRDVDVSGVTIRQIDETHFAIESLSEATAEYGEYVFTYDARTVRKRISGLACATVATLAWKNYPIDVVPPTVEEMLFNGAAPASAYVTDQMFTEVAVRFSEAVNVPELVEQGIAGQAFSIQLLSDDNAVVGTLPAEDIAWNASTFTASWTIDPAAVPCGKARLVVDPSLIKDESGNGLATTEAYDVISGAKAYTPSLLKSGVAYSYACPALYDWNNDGLLDLVVGEKTEDAKGKVRIYLNRGTANAPAFDDYTYLQKDGADVEFTAQGCVGMQVSFGHARGATMILSTSQGEIYGWRHRARKVKTKEAFDWELWFDHSTDARFSSLIRTQTFCCDMDGDGYDEVIVSGQNSPMFWIKRTMVGDEYVSECTPLMDASGANLQFPEGQNHTAAIMADVSGDAVLDLVTGDTSGNVWVYYGTGNGRFSATPLMIYENMETSNKRSRLTVGDIDGDGVEDILVGRQDGSVLLLKGEAVLAPAVNFKCVEIKSVEEALNDYIYWENGADGWTCEQFGEEAQATVTHTGDEQTTVLAAKFTGVGTVSFTWAVTGSNESSEFRCTGGNPELVKAGPFSQIAQTITLSTPGEHLVSWVFRGRNTAIVRDVAFTPSDEALQVTQTTVVPIPFVDINRFANDVWKAHGGDYEAAANATAANGRSVMENCIAGVDSSDPDAAFRAKITYEDGVAKISWMPALNGEIDHEGVSTGIRTYTVYGTENLETPNWQLVTPENKPSMRFFKVKVQMP